MIAADQGADFGTALAYLRRGMRVYRAGWNGKGMWLRLVAGSRCAYASDGKGYDRAPYIEMKTADNVLVPWLASQTDVLARDWTTLDEEPAR